MKNFSQHCETIPYIGPRPGHCRAQSYAQSLDYSQCTIAVEQTMQLWRLENPEALARLEEEWQGCCCEPNSEAQEQHEQMQQNEKRQEKQEKICNSTGSTPSSTPPMSRSASVSKFLWGSEECSLCPRCRRNRALEH